MPVLWLVRDEVAWMRYANAYIGESNPCPSHGVELQRWRVPSEKTPMGAAPRCQWGVSCTGQHWHFLLKKKRTRGMFIALEVQLLDFRNPQTPEI